MLTFELTNNESIEIHVDTEGLKDFIQALQKVLEAEDHLHLMSSEWGGNELSSEKQGVDNKLVNHVKIMKWT